LRTDGSEINAKPRDLVNYRKTEGAQCIGITGRLKSGTENSTFLHIGTQSSGVLKTGSGSVTAPRSMEG
jgi:hypothetical protein